MLLCIAQLNDEVFTENINDRFWHLAGVRDTGNFSGTPNEESSDLTRRTRRPDADSSDSRTLGRRRVRRVVGLPPRVFRHHDGEGHNASRAIFLSAPIAKKNRGSSTPTIGSPRIYPEWPMVGGCWYQHKLEREHDHLSLSLMPFLLCSILPR